MQPKAWFVAVLLVAGVGMAEPFILLATGGAAALLGAATIGAGIGAGAIVGAGIGAGAVVGAKAGLAKVGLAKAGLAKVGLGAVANTSYRSYGSNERSRSYGGSIRVSKRYRRELPGFTEAQEMLLQKAFELDQQEPCGLRLVCELATRNPAELTENEAIILNLLNQPHASDSAALHYDEAAHLGRTSGPDACASVYQRCGSNAAQVMWQLELLS